MSHTLKMQIGGCIDHTKCFMVGLLPDIIRVCFLLSIFSLSPRYIIIVSYLFIIIGLPSLSLSPTFSFIVKKD